MKVSSLLALIVVLSGCAAELRPAPTAQVLPGPGRPATAEAAGVRVVAQTGAWRAHPMGLPGVFTPILVTVDNQSDVPLRIRHSDFALVSGDGRRFATLAPGEVHGTVADPGPPAYAYSRGVFVARREPGGRVILSEPFPYDPFFDYFPGSTWTELPTRDMIQLALPERVLAPGTNAAGFVYFPRVSRNVSSADFTAALVDDRTGAPVATLAIPFVTR
ncbi:MAG: hypothetical protein AUH30_09795 [Candidatus Rokubacteria bacterium 13_1_40CM_68_15]|nr:MAG: hypothetical protein AUH30_09795 [Candidatus Rokubacteria bacterium 13_1_40CM_68_15]